MKAAKEAGVCPIGAIWAKTANTQKVRDMNPLITLLSRQTIPHGPARGYHHVPYNPTA
jgi:streptogramin lyase